jgi:putative nucleotidyltransferase with HDIG domain
MRLREAPPNQRRIYLLVGILSAVALALLATAPWQEPASPRLWNDVAVFALTAILSEAWHLRGAFANVSSSVAFVPLFASVLLFPHPIPMLIAAAALVVVETFVRRKPPIRVWFNTAQYMVAMGLASLVYSNLGGTVSTSEFSFSPVPFVALVATFFLINQGSVAAAVAISSGVSLRESWERIGGGARIYDLLASSLAILLAFLYVRHQFLGLAVVVLPLFLVRQLYQMNSQLQEELQEKLELMVRAIEARDPYTSGHSRRVAEYASAIARDLGLSAKALDNIKTAALLHDVGKIYEEFAPLLRKESRLTPEERMVMQTHVVRSADLIGNISKLKGAVLDTIRHHHENYDGSGYPDGLVGSAIPIGARIIMVCDTIDAMTTDRPYRKALGFDMVMRELATYAGRQFDPGLVEMVAKSPNIRRLLGVGGVYPEGPSPQPARARVTEARPLAHIPT